MGLNMDPLRQEIQGRLANPMVDYGGAAGRTAPRDRPVTPEHASSAPRHGGMQGDVYVPRMIGGVGVETRPRAEAGVAPAATQVAGSSPTATAAVGQPATKVAETGAPNPYPSQPSPVDELMGYTRMGSRTRPVSPTSGGPSGIPKGGP